MSWKRFTASLGLVALLAAADAARPDFARAAEADTLTLSAEGGALPRYSVRRTGPQEITVTFDPKPGESVPATPGVGAGNLVSGVSPVPGGFRIRLKTSAFGYVNYPVKDKPQLQIQIFPDAVGATWGQGAKAVAPSKADPAQAERSKAEKAKAEQAKIERAAEAKARAEKTRADQAEKAAQARMAKAAEDKAQAEAQARRQQEAKAAPPQPMQPPQAQQAPPAPQPAVQAQQSPPPQTAAQQAPPAPGTDGKPFFSVPYSMRMQVNRTVLGNSAANTATLPPVEGQPQAAPAPQPPQVAPQPPKTQQGGRVPPGVVERPLLQEHTTAAPAPRPAEGAAPVAIQLSPPPQPTPQSPAQARPVDLVPAKAQDGLRFRAERKGPGDPHPAELLSAATTPRPAAQSSTQSLQQGQPATAQPQPGKPWELRQSVQKVLAPSGSTGATLPQMGDAPPPGLHAENATGPQPDTHSANATAAPSAHADANATESHAANATAPNGHNATTPAAEQHNASALAAEPAHAEPGKGGKDKEQQGPLTEQQLKDGLLQAQSDMMGGKWRESVKALEALLREPLMKGELREETLYALADASMQAYKDSLAANYDRIAAAQQAAMNANLKSNRVPRAIINLGLLNLKVNNLPEARAYFNIIRKKYPQDQNAAIVPFSLGEYYREKGDLKKAAENYQDLIQQYPDSRMAKETAYILAQVLRRLGQFDKAFQIVDYLDKRWPLFYMENPGFLKLAAEVEEKVGKLDLAKDHYWTFYNLNPENEYADVVLVRIGDVYLRQNKRDAAKEVYQKALRDFPDREGGLVARMRLAEEGIYDDPTMTEMVSVFGRTGAPRPDETYNYIITRHPQSPLAPLAQIKLGMWQFHNKSYMDAMNTATAFLQKFPKSNLAVKAEQLGFQSFLNALPALVQEGNYARVMQLYDNAPFVKENQGMVGDEAQMAIAVSAWKRGQPDRALKLAGRFLGAKQVPKYSEMALDLAMNIFMERKEWKRISDLAARADKAWKLSPRQKAQFETARAMALENQGEIEKSLPLWTRIASDPATDPATRAHATYALAKDAARRQDMHRLFALSQEALGQLLASGGDKDKIKDCLLMAITATERSGRFAETVKWAREFDRIIPPSDPDWAPVRLRLAEVYRRGNMPDEWKALLTDIAKKKPGTVYARMAAQALESSALDQRLQNYLVKPPM